MKKSTKKKEDRKVILNNKDTVFRMLYSENEELLSLYNAVNGTHYENPDELEITTLENAIYMNMKNDVSCVLDMWMNLYEHQSTVNPNMPLRDLFYTARLYEKLTIGKDLYSSKQIMLPTPKYITFYNGAAKQPERRLMKLSDSFERSGEVNLELTVVQMNINPGFNEELKRNCPTLCQYMAYVEKVRTYTELLPIEEAVTKAVDECIKEDILRKFLIRNKAEAIQVSIFEYDEELHKRTLREEGYEEGMACGMERGRSEGKAEGKAEDILELLEELGRISEEIRQKILSEKNLEILKKWHKTAAKAESIEQFLSNMQS
ncbi:MAG: hypothetical protein HDR22_02835 [Lachnospiraceae bacterium]|nr:hypothetical protein [Lachnospiraceae bacterium]